MAVRPIDAEELLKQQYTMGFGQMPVVSVDAIKNAPTLTPVFQTGTARQTNADRIRAMSDEELAEWMCSLMTAECCDQRCPARDICNLGDNGLVKWMKQPAEED